jgi:Golgi phosphoprotein 3 (GPP34)
MLDQNAQPSTPAAHSLFQALRDLHLEAGEPSCRDLAKKCGPGNISHNTVNQILRGQKLPRQPHLEVLVHALGGDWLRFKALWCEARKEAGGAGADDPAADPVTGAEPDSEIQRLRAELNWLRAQLWSQKSPLDGADVGWYLGRHAPLSNRTTRNDQPDDPPLRYASRWVADELFLVGHDPHTGRRQVSRDSLATALAGAALGDLILAGSVFVGADSHLHAVGRRTQDDPVTGYILGELAGRNGTDPLREWVWHLRRDICPLVGQRLAAAGLVTSRRVRRPLTMRPVVDYPAANVVQAGRPAVRLGGHVLRQSSPPDVPTRLLAALVRAVDAEGRLAIDLPTAEIRRRLEYVAAALPAPLDAAVTAVASVKDALVETPRR